MADLPTWRPRPYPGFRESDNIDDRRNNSAEAELARAILEASAASVPQSEVAAGPSTLGNAVGIDDIVRSHGLWLLRQAIDAQMPRSFDDRFSPAKESLSEWIFEPVDKVTIPFGLVGPK